MYTVGCNAISAIVPMRPVHLWRDAGTVCVPGGVPTVVSSLIMKGEIGVGCPVCGTVMMARQMEDLNLGLREHAQRDLPRSLDTPLCS